MEKIGIETPKTALLLDVDGVVMNYDEHGGYKQNAEKNILNSWFLDRILQDQIDKDPKQSDESKLQATRQKVTSLFWNSWNKIRSSTGSPNPTKTSLFFASELEKEGLLSPSRFGSFEGDDPFLRTPRMVESIQEPTYFDYHAIYSPEEEKMSPEQKKELYIKREQAAARFKLAHEVANAFDTKGKATDLLYPGARNAVSDIRQFSKVVMWTEGDPDEQWRKIIDGKLFSDQRLFEESRPAPGKEIPLHLGLSHGSVKEWITRDRMPVEFYSEHISSRDKKADLGPVIQKLLNEGYQDIVVADDKADNLVAVLTVAERLGISDKIRTFWIQQGRHGQKPPEGMTLEEAMQKFSAVKSISELPKRIKAA